jgi:hypothetical protein
MSNKVLSKRLGKSYAPAIFAISRCCLNPGEEVKIHSTGKIGRYNMAKIIMDLVGHDNKYVTWDKVNKKIIFLNGSTIILKKI